MDEDSVNIIAESIPALSKYFIGVLPKNQIPRYIIRKYPICFIVNTDKFLERGTHWFAVFITSHEDIYLFDSLGQDPREDKYVMNLVHQFGKKILYFTNIQVPPINTSSCALYSI